LREVVARHASASLRRHSQRDSEAITAFTEGAAQSDDITVLVLEFQGGGPIGA